MTDINRRKFLKGIGALGFVPSVTNNEIIGVGLGNNMIQGGDSGGLFFHESNGEAYMVGVIKGIEEGFDYGTTAETTENVLSGNWLTQ